MPAPPPDPTTAPTLTDGVVTLRAHRPEDAQGAWEQCQDPQMQRWTSVPVPCTHEDAARFVGEVMPAAWREGRSWAFAVEHEGVFAGSVELRPDADRAAGVAEIAFGAHPRVRGRGVMERAVRLVLAWAFDEAGVETVWWRAHVGNWASRRLAWKVGFRVEGTVRSWVTQRGERHDAWVGSLLRGDPREPQTPWLRAPVLDGDGVRLRPFVDADVLRVVEGCSDARTQRWLGNLPSPYTVLDAAAYLVGVEDRQARNAGVTWAVVDPETDLLLGSMGLFALAPGEECEVGYWTHPEARGRGVTTRAVGLALRHAFGALGVRRVLGFVAVGNDASRHVLEANGLRSYGVERRGAVVREGRVDQVCLDVLLEEWTRHAVPTTAGP